MVIGNNVRALAF